MLGLLGALKFLTSPAGKAGLVGLLLLGVLAYGDYSGAARERAKGEAANLRAELAAVERDLNVARLANDRADALAAEANARETTLTQRLNDYEQQFSDPDTGDTHNACLLDRADVERLLLITR